MEVGVFEVREMSFAVVALLIILSLLSLLLSLVALRESKATLRASEKLLESLQSETVALVRETTSMLVGTKKDVSRVEDLLEMSELRSGAINDVSKVAIGAIAAPIVRFRALKLGYRRAKELFVSRRRIG
ncbi:hypothetical protein SAMN02745225_00285 [Ferrithrix thermotolerans DSM 19514]|uniref:DUF948 domain-containing protein n=2 Tax=Ferrithrix TaxID=643949 RepID=A0A1M4SHK8_9ACTN|nr:hypothetical protein SAMN02745225_00285 [Ferrithrix thermotolerans DSM 19514]